MILLTGSEGFIGKNLSERLTDNVIKIDLKTGGDITNEEYLSGIFSKNNIDTVIHLAAFPGVKFSTEHPETVFKNNIYGFDVLAKTAISNNVKHFIYASSSSVYGENGILKSPYAISKRTNELQADMYSSISNTKFTGLRFFTVYGKYIRQDLAISKFIDAIRNNKEIHIYGDGTQTRDFTYVDDICTGILCVMNSDKSWRHEIFDVGYGNSISVNNLVTLIKNIINPNFDNIIYEDDKWYDVSNTLADTTKMYDWFGFKPKYDIETGLKMWLDH